MTQAQRFVRFSALTRSQKREASMYGAAETDGSKHQDPEQTEFAGPRGP